MSEGTNHPEPIRLEPVTLSRITVSGPESDLRMFDGKHGRMWQWIGDGRELISLAVSVRRDTQLNTDFGVRGHLVWELDRLHGSGPAEDREADVPGAAHAAAGTVDALKEGIRTHNEVLVATDRHDMYVVHAMVTDSAQGRALAQRVLASVSF